MEKDCSENKFVNPLKPFHIGNWSAICIGTGFLINNHGD